MKKSELSFILTTLIKEELEKEGFGMGDMSKEPNKAKKDSKWTVNYDTEHKKPLYESKGKTSKDKLRNLLMEVVEGIVNNEEKREVQIGEELVKMATQNGAGGPSGSSTDSFADKVLTLGHELITIHNSSNSSSEKSPLGVSEDTISKTKNVLDQMIAERSKKKR